jgi:hypothetical protein
MKADVPMMKRKQGRSALLPFQLKRLQVIRKSLKKTPPSTDGIHSENIKEKNDEAKPEESRL